MTVRMRFRTAGMGVALLALPFVPTPQAQTAAAQHWVATWGTAQQSYRAAAAAEGGPRRLRRRRLRLRPRHPPVRNGDSGFRQRCRACATSRSG